MNQNQSLYFWRLKRWSYCWLRSRKWPYLNTYSFMIILHTNNIYFHHFKGNFAKLYYTKDGNMFSVKNQIFSKSKKITHSHQQQYFESLFILSNNIKEDQKITFILISLSHPTFLFMPDLPLILTLEQISNESK